MTVMAEVQHGSALEYLLPDYIWEQVAELPYFVRHRSGVTGQVLRLASDGEWHQDRAALRNAREEDRYARFLNWMYGPRDNLPAPPPAVLPRPVTAGEARERLRCPGCTVSAEHEIKSLGDCMQSYAVHTLTHQRGCPVLRQMTVASL